MNGQDSKMRSFAAPVPIPAAIEALPPRVETVLLVEDDAAVAQVAAQVLAGCGYRVLSAGNGRDALHLFLECDPTEIDLVIADLIMPRMGGRMMVEWMKTMSPDLKVLFTSGCPREIAASRGGPVEDTEFLPKPFTPAKLLGAVRDLLDAESAEHTDNLLKFAVGG